MENRNSAALNWSSRKKKRAEKQKQKQRRAKTTTQNVYIIFTPRRNVNKFIISFVSRCDSGRYSAWISLAFFIPSSRTHFSTFGRPVWRRVCVQTALLLHTIWFTSALSHFVPIQYMAVVLAQLRPFHASTFRAIFLLIIISVSCALLPSFLCTF